MFYIDDDTIHSMKMEMKMMKCWHNIYRMHHD